jgi:glutamine amidotransferase
MTVVVDYQAGNLRSVETALRRLGASYRIARRPQELEGAERLVFPGVGEARAAAEVLRQTGLGPALADFHRTGKPMLGICIGCQIIFEHSEERDTRALGLLPGEVRRFPPGEGRKVPHMGWNQVLFQPERRKHPLFAGIADGSWFYFVHSYYADPARREDAAALTAYGRRFPSVILRDNLAAVQFHTEKSAEPGLRLLANFLAWRP